MTVIPSGFAQVTHRFGGGGLPLGAAVTYGIGLTFAAGLDAIAAEVHDAYGDIFMVETTSDVSLLSTLVKAGPNDVGPFFEFTGIVTGTEPGDQESPGAALLIHKVTAIGGRRSRGRFYLPGAAGTDFGDNGAVQPAAVTKWQNAANAFLTRIVAHLGITDMYLLHSESSPDTENPTPVPVPTVITNLVVDSLQATQRRRLRR